MPEPHVATLATVDEDGMPDSRSLILRGVDERGWAFRNRVEFWQGSPDRDHTRIVYERTDAGWTRTVTPWTG